MTEDSKPVETKNDSEQPAIPVAVPAANPVAFTVDGWARFQREALRVSAQAAGVFSDSAGQAIQLEFKRARLFETIARIQHEQHGGVAMKISEQKVALEAYARTYIPGYTAATTADAISQLEENYKGKHNNGRERVEKINLTIIQPQAQSIAREGKELEEGLAVRAAALASSPQDGNFLAEPLLAPGPSAPVLSWPNNMQAVNTAPVAPTAAENKPTVAKNAKLG